MKKILLTNNLKIVQSYNEEYDKVYTNSPYIVERYKDAIYLDTLIDESLNEIIGNIRKTGFEINRHLVEEYFPKYHSLHKGLLNIYMSYTNIYIYIFKLLKLIEIHPNYEVVIFISYEELSNFHSPPVEGITNRFMNCYYWLAELVKIKKIKKICIDQGDIKYNILKKNFFDAHLIGHSVINSYFLRLINLDKKVLIFNLKKKLKLINKNKKNIYLYKKNFMIREIEPYLYDLGFNLVEMPEMSFEFKNTNNDKKYNKLKIILDKFFDNNPVNKIFKQALYEMYKYNIKYYAQKEKYTEDYIFKLDKSIKFIISSTLNGFDSYIFTKQLQRNDYKIINVMHGLTTNFLKDDNLIFNESENPDLTLTFNKSERDRFLGLNSNKTIYSISAPQETKKKRFSYLQRFFANKIIKTNNELKIFYPSIIYPYNNVTIYGYRRSDKWNFEFEKKMILLLSKANKKAIYKHYPMKSFIGANPLIEYAKSFKNINVIEDRFDFRFVSSSGDIFILGSIGSSSTITWMLGENKPIIFLKRNNFNGLSEEALKILEKILIVIDIDKINWIDNLTNLLNMPYEDLVKIWKDKQIYRDQYDEDWLIGNNLHAGKLGSGYINKFITENK